MGKAVSSCLGSVKGRNRKKRADENEDRSQWSKDLEKHFSGDLSFAVVQANEEMEDHSQVEVCPEALFVGVYDGHGGPQASLFVRENLFLHLINLVKETGTMSEDVIRNAFAATEEGFLNLVRQEFELNQEIAGPGSCCLVGIIWGETLYVASLGDSRAILCYENESKNIRVLQLSREHNACFEEVREELRALHPDDPRIVVMDANGVWRVKGVIQVSRAIGDACLKFPEFALDESHPRFHLSEPITRPVLIAEPTLYTRVLGPNDKFLIFASDGLWEYLSNQMAAHIVSIYPRPGAAQMLIRYALEGAAARIRRTYQQIIQTEKGHRRHIHDDITVIVIFIDHLDKKQSVPEQSIQGFIDVAGPSHFINLRGISLSTESAAASSGS